MEKINTTVLESRDSHTVTRYLTFCTLRRFHNISTTFQPPSQTIISHNTEKNPKQGDILVYVSLIASSRRASCHGMT